MQKCSYCGKEYSDEATICAVDGQLLARDIPDTLNQTRTTAPTRPSVLAACYFIWAAFTAIYLGAILFDISFRNAGYSAAKFIPGPAIELFFQISIAVGLLQTRRWARSLCFYYVGLQMLARVLFYFAGAKEVALIDLLRLVVCGFSVYVLTRPPIRALFLGEQRIREDSAYELLYRAIRCESKGKISEAIAGYEDVRQRYPGTDAAKDAEASILSLKAKVQ